MDFNDQPLSPSRIFYSNQQSTRTAITSICMPLKPHSTTPTSTPTSRILARMSMSGSWNAAISSSTQARNIEAIFGQWPPTAHYLFIDDSDILVLSLHSRCLQRSAHAVVSNVLDLGPGRVANYRHHANARVRLFARISKNHRSKFHESFYACSA